MSKDTKTLTAAARKRLQSAVNLAEAQHIEAQQLLETMGVALTHPSYFKVLASVMQTLATNHLMTITAIS
jgi:hypothetical protein